MTADLYFEDERIPGDVVEDRARRLAGGLACLGVDDGDVIAVMLRNTPAFIDAIMACQTAGCFYCPINWHFKASEAGYLLQDSGAKVLLIQADLLEQIADAIPESVTVLVVANGADGDAASSAPGLDYERWLAQQAPYDGPARTPRGHMAYTSGTTGRPKGVRRLAPPPEQAEAQRDKMLAMVATAWGVRPGVRVLVPAPLYHSAPSSVAQQGMLQGEVFVLAPRFDAEQTLALIERHRIDTVFLVPIMFVRLLRLPQSIRARYDISSVRFVSSTGAPCPPQVKREMLDWWGDVIYETYASSETGMITIQSPEHARRKPASVGPPLGDAVIRIVDDRGRECATGEAGMIYCQQPAITDFTYQNRDADRQAAGFDGLATVGDIGYLDADGDLYMCDRSSDLVISGGVNIYPAEIENTLMSLPGIADCAVFGVADAEYGQSLVATACVDDNRGWTEATLRERLREMIAAYKVPRTIELVDELPRDDNGKVAKHRLKQQWEARQSS